MASLTNNNGSVGRLGGRAAKPAPKVSLVDALEGSTYEVLPFKSAEDKVLASVPKNIALTVTTTEAKGLGPTIDLAARLGDHGYKAAPHIAARLVRDKSHLQDIVDQLQNSGVDSIFVIAGDAEVPAGIFPDALSVLEGLAEIGHSFGTVGIGGYPDGHGKITDELIEKALERKAPFATQMITQLCFDADQTIEWAEKVHARGVQLPIRVGIPGAINRQKLIRVSAGLGLGQSASFLKKQQSMFWRFFLPGGYSPNKLVTGLTAAFGRSDNNLSGFHIFTFNELEDTEKWRQNWLAKLR